MNIKRGGGEGKHQIHVGTTQERKSSGAYATTKRVTLGDKGKREDERRKKGIGVKWKGNTSAPFPFLFRNY
jgi:hypothetical protein